MLRELVPALRMLLVLTVLTGVIYPLGMTAIARVVFARPAGGSLIVRDGRAVGSSLVGQPFSDPRYFWGRLSATSPAYNGAASSGSNFGPLHPALLDAARARAAALRAVDPENTQPIPLDLLTASGSGLDPHISPAGAEYQIARVARVRGLPEDDVRALVRRHTQGRQLGILGDPCVNVLELNLTLDAAARGGAQR